MSELRETQFHTTQFLNIIQFYLNQFEILTPYFKYFLAVMLCTETGYFQVLTQVHLNTDQVKTWSNSVINTNWCVLTCIEAYPNKRHKIWCHDAIVLTSSFLGTYDEYLSTSRNTHVLLLSAAMATSFSFSFFSLLSAILIRSRARSSWRRLYLFKNIDSVISFEQFSVYLYSHYVKNICLIS